MANYYLDEAIYEFKEAIRNGPNESVYHYNLGLTFEELGGIEKALHEYQEAINYDVNNEAYKTRLKNLIVSNKIDITKLVDKPLDSELSKIWDITEIKLRRIVLQKMIEQFGVNWEDKMVKKHRELTNTFDECREKKERESKSHNGRCSDSLLDYTYPEQLFKIILSEWKTFEPIFKKQKDDFRTMGNELQKIRTPIAHNRLDTLPEHEKKVAYAYCEQILCLLQDK